MSKSWSDLAGNEYVTFYTTNTAHGCPFNPHVTLPTNRNDEKMTKSEVLYYLDIVHANLDGLHDQNGSGTGDYHLVRKDLLSSATVYSSVSVTSSGSATKNNCPGISAGTGSSVTYYVTVSAGTYTSTTSQAAANVLAQSAADAQVASGKQEYANSTGTCSIIYSNVAKSATVTRNNCTGGFAGSSVTYTVAAGTYTSLTSQAYVDGLAQSDVDANKQSYANANGTCPVVYYSISKSAGAYRNNCTLGYQGSYETYTVAASNVVDITSQADVDARAQANANAGAQAYANSVGSCPVVYYNVTKTATATRNNCGTAYNGSSVTYTIAANTYNNITSQASVDATAQSAVDSGVQAYANANGTCTLRTTAWRPIGPYCVQVVYYNDEYSVVGLRNNCGTGYTGGPATYTVAASTYSSTTSKDVANQLAIDDANTNYQAYANIHGTCVLTNPPAETWVPVTLPTTLPSGASWSDVCIGTVYIPPSTYFAGGTVDVFVVVSINTSKILYSTNGTNWVVVETGTNINANSIIYGDGKFIMVGTNKRIMTSTNLTTWTASTVPGDNSNGIITYANSLFVIVYLNGNIALTSSDGSTWAPEVTPIGQTGWLDVIYTGDRFIAVSSNSYGNAMVRLDSTGTWSTLVMNPAYTHYQGIAYSGSILVAASLYETTHSSDLGSNWTPVTPSGTPDFRAIRYGNGVFVTVGLLKGVSPVTIIKSTDNGATWTQVNTVTGYQSVVYSSAIGKWVAVGYGIVTAIG